MRKDGFLKSHQKIHGEWKDCFLYAMLREEWEFTERAAAPELAPHRSGSSATAALRCGGRGFLGAVTMA